MHLLLGLAKQHVVYTLVRMNESTWVKDSLCLPRESCCVISTAGYADLSDVNHPLLENDQTYYIGHCCISSPGWLAVLMASIDQKKEREMSSYMRKGVCDSLSNYSSEYVIILQAGVVRH